MGPEDSYDGLLPIASRGVRGNASNLGRVFRS